MRHIRDIRTYEELITLPTFKERFEYLRLDNVIGESTFGFDRYINQRFYRSKEWASIRSYVIVRDTGNEDYCQDLGVKDHSIFGQIIIHHMNPIDVNDIRLSTEYLLDPNYLISTSLRTHNGIHYGCNDISMLEATPVVRQPNDTCLWR